MKKIILPILLFCLLLIILIPISAGAAIVTCNGPNCKIEDFFDMLGKIYDFIVKTIATPLAIIAVSVGGILMLISAGNPEMFGLGKKVLWSAIIGLVLAYGSWIIIDFILKAIGASGL